MGDSRVEIEALALGTMRAWVANDAKAMKKLTHRDYVMIVGTMPLQMLDRPSYLAAMERGFACTRFAFREVFANPYGKTASLVAGAELELALGPKAWAGPFLITDVWRKGTIGGWKLAERSLAPLEQGEGFAASVRKLQLWK
jgi:Domain of unknown function (DUF4440)